MAETITIIRQTATDQDEYGNPTTETTNITVDGCLVGWGSTSEPALADSDPVTAQLTLYMPAGTVVEDGDEFVIRGDSFVKDGMAQAWSSMLNVSKGVVVMLRRHDG